ncbi:putative laccase-9 [Rosa rugosa]|uniref:putative laccase-9 n=1 Tax=Rosa rugosa TaxID=74645 RepID=UPI002B40CB7D|nr:putative laccase-9 [Rosa rugosa]
MGIFPGFLGLFLLCGMLHCIVECHVHYHDFVLKKENFTRLCYTKSMLVVNGSFPGPVIRVQKGDTVFVNVHNQGDYGVTIHWHGVHQPRNSWSDGPEYITQCAIKPGSNFTYEVIFSDEEGTLWWHAHSEWTRASVHGAIVIMPVDNTKFPFPKPDGEDIIVFGSWYNSTEDVSDIVAEALEDGGDTPDSDCYTINGQPGDFLPCSNDSTYHLQVEYGKTYLLRLVNAVMNSELFFAIAEHSLTVVGIDASYVKPIVTDYIMISAGQTMDILITANQSPGAYYMATRQYNTVRKNIDDYDNSNVTAILQYKEKYTPLMDPVFPSILPTYFDIVSGRKFTRRIKSLASIEHPANVPKNISTRMFITAASNYGFINRSGEYETGVTTSLNNLSWVNPETDVLLSYYRNITGFYTPDFPDFPPFIFDFASEDFAPDTVPTIKGTKVKVLEYDEEVEIVFQGTDLMRASEDHPMHMHGYSFYVVGSGTGNFDNETDPKGYNLFDPPKMNTVSLPKVGWVAIRFKASNPGVWFWHCHFDRHLTWGMSFVIIVKDGGTPETSIRKPPPNMPQCTSSSTIKLQPFHDFSRTGDKSN